MDGKALERDYYNGHYSGTARNSTSNTTHIVLSSDAHRYVAKNFQKNASGAAITTEGYPENAYVTIVSGAGAGQQAIANLITHVAGVNPNPTLVLRSALTTAIDDTSVYSISMKPVSPFDASNRYDVSQIGCIPAKTNHYGEKLGVLHIPSDDRVKFTTGRKLVEIADRYSQQAWRVTSYASGYYEAAGQSRQEVSTSLTPDRLTGISFNHPEANGTWTATQTDAITFVPGSANYGVISGAAQTHYREQFNGIWANIRDNYPEVYNQYYRGYFDQWIIDADVPEQEN